MENELAGKEVFERSLSKIERVIDFIGVRHRLNPVEREDFGSYVSFKLHGLDDEGLHHAEAQAVWIEKIDIDVESALANTVPLATASR